MSRGTIVGNCGETSGTVWENVIAEAKKPTWLIFLEQFKDFLVIILIIAALISAFTGDLESFIVIIAVITMNAILGTVQTVKAEKSLSNLKSCRRLRQRCSVTDRQQSCRQRRSLLVT